MPYPWVNPYRVSLTHERPVTIVWNTHFHRNPSVGPSTPDQASPTLPARSFCVFVSHGAGAVRIRLDLGVEAAAGDHADDLPDQAARVAALADV